ncbi:MAG: 2-oxoacid:ferredoxin oxidoreductase subunit gamma [Methanosphaera sp.]|nr:2-oxoacid:ferredoxin oxidoreductase subunit gamma [Methanosphaera sp.]
MRTDIRIAGFGGQGVLMCGIVIAKAASLFDKNYAVQTQSYGPEARGGASRTEVVVSDEQIDYPKVENPEIFVAMSHEALIKYIDDIKTGATLLIDPDLVYQDEIKDIIEEKQLQVYHSKATQTAEQTIGKKIVSNIVMLGSFVEATGIITEESAKQSILDSVPKGTEELNLQAFEEGKKIVKKIN